MGKIYVTGLSGFFGHNLILRLRELGPYQIIGLDRKEGPRDAFLEADPSVEMRVGDILDKASLEAFFSDISEEDCIIHAAARISLYGHFDKLTMETNYQGTVNLVEALNKRKIKRFLFVSSVDALPQKEKGAKVEAPKEYDPKGCPGVYGKAKALASNYILEKVREEGLPAIIVNPSAVIGPNDPYNAPMNDAILRFLKGKIPVLTPGGYDVVDVRDVVDGILSALERGNNGDSYLLTGNNLTVRNLFKVFSDLSGAKLPKGTLPFWLLRILAPFAEIFARIARKRPMFSPLAIHLLSHNPLYDHSKSEKDLGYSPRTIEESAKDLIDYFKSSGKLS